MTIRLSNIDKKELLEIAPQRFKARIAKATTYGQLADILYTVYHARLAEEKKAKPFKDLEILLKDMFIENVAGENGTGIIGKQGHIQINEKDVFVIEDRDLFRKYVNRTKGYDMTNQGINQAAIRARFEDGKVVKGVGTIKVKKCSIKRRK